MANTLITHKSLGISIRLYSIIHHTCRSGELIL